MIKKQTKNTYVSLEKVLTIAGLAVIIIGCIANLYGAYTNSRFINSDPLAAVYYFRFILLLGGGFTIGYLVTKKLGERKLYSKLFSGVFYAALAMALFWLSDLLRLGIQSTSWDLSYPWGKIFFMGTPLLALITTVAIAYMTQYRSNRLQVSKPAKITLLFSFIAYELYSVISGAYAIITGVAHYSPTMPILLIIGSYFLIPLVITAICYLALGAIKKRIDRLFYATLIGLLYSTLMFSLWEVRTDASAEATNIFATIVSITTIIFTGLVLWRARKAVK